MSEFFFFNDTATTEIYTLSLHDALPISSLLASRGRGTTAPLWGAPVLSFAPRLAPHGTRPAQTHLYPLSLALAQPNARGAEQEPPRCEGAVPLRGDRKSVV